MKDTPPPRRPGADPALAIYPVEAGMETEQLRANAIARIGAMDATAPATFFPPELAGGFSFESAWQDWREGVFSEWLGPKFVAIHLAAGTMESDRIAAIDREIDLALSPQARKRSLKAAQPYLEGRTQVRRQPQWVKFLNAQQAGEIPGHLTSIFSLQAALFHLPLLPALIAYVNFEGANGRAAMAGKERLDLETFARSYPEGSETAREVFRRAWHGDDDDDNVATGGQLACI